MILVDTNIIIDFWRKPAEKERMIFLTQKIYICGIVKAELLHGAKDKNSYKKILKGLKAFPEININQFFWDILGENFYLMKKAGISIPFQDAMIATIAINNRLKLWTKDAHFIRAKNVLNQLEFFDYNSFNIQDETLVTLILIRTINIQNRF